MKVETLFLRTGHNYDRDAVSFETGIVNDEPSMTKQSFAEECDINTIVERFGLTGELPSQIEAPQFAHFEEIYDFHSAQNAIVAAREAFMAMPAHVRAKFENDPGRFVEFCSDEANRDEAVKLGLVLPEKVVSAPDREPIKEPVKGDGTVST